MIYTARLLAISLAAFLWAVPAIAETAETALVPQEQIPEGFEPYKGKLGNVRNIILDPGHGGRDFGAKSRNLFLEKDFTRKLAFVLKKLIERRNDKRVSVTLTNPGRGVADQTQRAFAANKNRGELFISLHAASGYDQSSRNLGIYISPRSAAESGSWKEANGRHHTDNAVFAEKLRKTMEGFYPHKEFFIHEGKFLPLYGVDMPGALVEVIALNDPKDEMMINEKDFYENLAERIYAAIGGYDKTL